VDSKTIQELVIPIFKGPAITRSKNSFGCSQIAFCLNKLLLEKRTGKEITTNSKMVIGTIIHKYIFPQLIESSQYGKYKWYQRNLRPTFERIVHYDDTRGFNITGHVDCDIPLFDRIIELKTTWSNKEYSTDDFLTKAYILQANAEAYLSGRKFYEIWIISLSFDNVLEINVSKIGGETSKENFEEFLTRCWYVNEGLNNEIDMLTGPEATWECKYCSFKDECLINKKEVKQIEEDMEPFLRMLPDTKIALVERNAAMFNKALKSKKIKYNKQTKKYERDANGGI